MCVAEEMPLLPWLAAIQERLVAMREFEWSPPVDVHGWSDVPRGRPLFQSIVIVQNTPLDAALAGRAGRLGVSGARVHEQTSYPLTVAAIPGDAILLRLGYDARRFDGAAVARMAGHLRTLLEGIADDPDRPLAEIPLLTAEEQERLIPTRVGIDGGAGTVPAELDRLNEDTLDAYLRELRGMLGN